MEFVTEPAKQIPVYAETDLCVIGGSATGVFAAVRAARLGLKVLLIEMDNALGGVAGNALINVWHSYHNMTGTAQVISGLTQEVSDRLHAQGLEVEDGAPPDKPYRRSHKFNPHELKIELDLLCKEAGVKTLFHTMYCGLNKDGNRITHIYVANKDGISAIRARFFIDASGDGDLARDFGIESFRNDNIQPPSPSYLVQGRFSKENIGTLIAKYQDEVDLKPDWGWSTFVPGLDDIIMHADTHIFDLHCEKADDLSFAEIEGRRQIRECLKLMRNHGNKNKTYGLVSLYSHIGIRDTVHYQTIYQANHLELMLGTRYDDCILNGTYVSDVHLKEGGITFRGFDGTYVTELPNGKKVRGSWWKEMGVPADHEVPTHYSLPFRAIVPETAENFIAAGRMLNADIGAFGALRVMVNLNQIGEAAGVAAYLALNGDTTVQKLDGVKVAKLLSKGGSANLG